MFGATNTSAANGSVRLPTGQEFIACIGREDFDTWGVPTCLFIFYNVVLVLTSVPAILGNLLILVAIWKTPSLHSPSNVLLFGLALTDFGVGLIVEPLDFIYAIAKLNRLINIFCNTAVILRLFAALLCLASLLTATAISLDLYIALRLHLRYQEIVTVKRMVAVVIAIWVCSTIAGLLNVWYLVRLLPLRVAPIILCLVVTTTTYYRVFRIVRHHQKQIHTQRQAQQRAEQDGESSASIRHQEQALRTKFLIYCLLLVCYFPFIVMTAVVTLTDFSVTKQSIYLMSFLLVYANSVLNPFVYCWRFQKIRAAVIETTKKILRRQTLSS